MINTGCVRRRESVCGVFDMNEFRAYSNTPRIFDHIFGGNIRRHDEYSLSFDMHVALPSIIVANVFVCI